MILLPMILTPVGITILLFVISWTERTLDREPRPERTRTAAIFATSAVAGLTPAQRPSAPAL